MSPGPYNGWTNFATWAIYSELRNVVSYSKVVGELEAEPENETDLRFAGAIRVYVTDEVLAGILKSGPGIASEIVKHQVDDVDWLAIAKAWRS